MIEFLTGSLDNFNIYIEYIYLIAYIEVLLGLEIY